MGSDGITDSGVSNGSTQKGHSSIFAVSDIKAYGRINLRDTEGKSKMYIEIAEKPRIFDGNGRMKFVKQSEAAIENILLIIVIAYCIFGVTPAE